MVVSKGLNGRRRSFETGDCACISLKCSVLYRYKKPT
jgi:hypothetical protein